MLVLIGWLVSILIVLAYFLANKTGSMTVFNVANGVGAILLVPIYIISGLWFAAFLSAFFGLVGWYGILKPVRKTDSA